jgi:molybdopterin converting factor small subunit
MKFKVKLWGQLKHLTGSEFVEAEAENIDTLVISLATTHPEIRQFLVSGDKPNTSILAFINDTQHVWGSDAQLKENDAVTLMSPIAGG